MGRNHDYCFAGLYDTPGRLETGSLMNNDMLLPRSSEMSRRHVDR